MSEVGSLHERNSEKTALRTEVLGIGQWKNKIIARVARESEDRVWYFPRVIVDWVEGLGMCSIA